MTPDQLDRWRVVPRILVTLYGILCYMVVSWYMSLPDPSAEQTTFATGIMAGAAAWFKFYVDSGAKHGNPD